VFLKGGEKETITPDTVARSPAFGISTRNSLVLLWLLLCESTTTTRMMNIKYLEKEEVFSFDNCFFLLFTECLLLLQQQLVLLFSAMSRIYIQLNRMKVAARTAELPNSLDFMCPRNCVKCIWRERATNNNAKENICQWFRLFHWGKKKKKVFPTCLTAISFVFLIQRS
jgi:hypothetical protein